MSKTMTAMISIAMALGVAGAVRADTHAGRLNAECLDDLAKIETRHIGIRDHMHGLELRDLKVLRGAARAFVRKGMDDSCEEVVEGIEEILATRRGDLVEKGIMVDVDEAARRRRVNNARPVTDFATPIRASDVIGTELQNLKAQSLGQVDDVIVEADGVRISHLLVSTGGFLGIGEDLVVVPFKRLSATENLDTLVLAISQERLDAAPKVTSDDMRELAKADWRKKNDDFYAAGPAD